MEILRSNSHGTLAFEYLLDDDQSKVHFTEPAA
eukprot:COSAG01_NODE_53342_length_340_cov_0.431535_1_plen_32_part_01